MTPAPAAALATACIFALLLFAPAGRAQDGLNQTCQPSDEVCDGKDNNCNGQVDELPVCCEPYDMKPCGSDIGTCRAGHRDCVDYMWSDECQNEIPPREELCVDLLDENCNGQVDEKPCIMPVGVACTGGPIDRPCNCQGFTRSIGFCCSGTYSEKPCGGLIPESEWNILIYFGIGMFAIAAGLMAYSRYAAGAVEKYRSE